MDAADLIRMGHEPGLQAQLIWARSQHTYGPHERLLLYELVALAAGQPEARASAALLSGLTGLSRHRVETALVRFETRHILTRHRDADGEPVIHLAFPPRDTPPDNTNKPECAHVRTGEGE